MRTALKRSAISVLVFCCVAGTAIANNEGTTVTFVELKQEAGNAVLVVELTNVSSDTIGVLQYGCWTEDRSKIEGAGVSGSRFMAFNTGQISWSGELKPGETVVAEGVIDGMPGAMIAMFSEQSFVCGT